MIVLPQVISKRPILFKKKVSFKSPIIAGAHGSKHSSYSRSATGNDTSSLVKQTEPDDFEDEKSPESVKFFDFASDSERDMQFEMMRERAAKLRNIPLFPLTAAAAADDDNVT